jgi:exopolysaccharide biosynthesis protein
LELWALKVDLTEPSLDLVVNGEGPALGVIPSTTISGFVRDYGCIAGINTNPFAPVSAKVGEDRTITGITISGGILAAAPHPPFGALVFYTDGSAAIVEQAALGDPGDIRNAVGGFYIVLQDGEVPEQTRARSKARHPRSAAGLSADGRTLYLLVIDGRRPGSIGATEPEIGLILRQLGAWHGLNFDGGGSTALSLRYPDGNVRAVNTPIHHGIPRRERAVATCLGLKMKNPGASSWVSSLDRKFIILSPANR